LKEKKKKKRAEGVPALTSLERLLGKKKQKPNVERGGQGQPLGLIVSRQSARCAHKKKLREGTGATGFGLHAKQGVGAILEGRKK